MLEESFKSNEEKELFLKETLTLQLRYGSTSHEYRDYLIKLVEVNPKHSYAYYYLYESFIYDLELEEAKKVAWNIISIKDTYFSQELLRKLDDTNYIFEMVYRFGDKTKLPHHIIQSQVEEDDSLEEWIKDLGDNNE